MRPALLSFLLLCLCLYAKAQVPNPVPSNPTEIEVDGVCRIATIDLRDPAKPRLRHHYDSGICHLDGGVKRSVRWEKTIRNGVGKDTAVEVIEREFLLHNPYPQPVTFLVRQQIGKNFHIDSDPPPTEVLGSTATFRVIAEANQTVRLHVGERN